MNSRFRFKKPSYEMYKIALAVLTVKVQITLEEPDSQRGRSIAKAMEEKTGINRLKVQRLQNAILNGKVRNHFMDEELEDLSWKIFKAILSMERPPGAKLRGQISGFANQQKFSLNLVLETYRKAFHEIIEENLSDQTKP